MGAYAAGAIRGLTNLNFNNLSGRGDVLNFRAQQADMPVILSSPGTVEAMQTVIIKPRVDGQIVELCVAQGAQHVLDALMRAAALRLQIVAGEDAHAVFVKQAIEQVVDAGFRPQQLAVLGTCHQHDGTSPGILGLFAVDGQLFLMNWEVRDSLDGRYFGPIPADSVIGRAVPLWTDEEGVGRYEWRAPTH
mgnify:CR=1 FL=1